ncbi:hypothetical protein Pan258_58520 [Symmachiella dynata]|nr:hypothetical protein Pan258_58520 [Symmachiella dynata]
MVKSYHQRSRKAGLSQGGDRPAFSVPINSLSEVGNFEQGRESCLQVVSKPSDASRKILYYQFLDRRNRVLKMGLGAQHLSFEFDAVLLHLLVERRAIDAQQFGGVLTIPAVALQGFDDDLAFRGC